MYDLIADGLLDVKRFIEIERVGRDPLSGIIDGSNTLFFTTYNPILSSGSLVLYEGATVVPATDFTIDYDSGEIIAASAPSQQFRATYYVTQYTNTRLTRFLMNSFQFMEAAFRRNWRLSSSASTYAAVDETSGSMYIVDATTMIDPVTGSKTFSTSHVQVGFFLSCLELTMAMWKLDQAADGFMWREDRGITVDKSRVAQNRAQYVEFVKKRHAVYLQAAQEEYYASTHYGGFVGNPITEDYLYNFEWQEGSKTYDYRSLRGHV